VPFKGHILKKEDEEEKKKKGGKKEIHYLGCFYSSFLSLSLSISAFKYNPFATKLKACSVRTATTSLAKCKVLIEVQAEAKEIGDNLNMINPT